MASRKQRIRKILHNKAQKGCFSTRTRLYPSEIKNLRRQGFIVEEIKQNPYGDVIPVKISWRHPNVKDENSLCYALDLYTIALKKRNQKNN